MARDHGVSRANGYRYLDEVINVLAGQAPDLHDALDRAQTEGTGVCDPRREDLLRRPLWRETHEHGGNIQALFGPDSFPRWVANVEPGSIHDLTAAREQVFGALY